MRRREMLGLARSALLVSAASPLAPLLAAPRAARAAMILPLTGERSALGLSMGRAASLGEKQGDGPLLLDANGKGGAAGAAATALRKRADAILGPLLSADVRPVLAAVAGRVPVLAFSNDEALRGSGAFLMGLTARQLASAVLRYARTRGVRAVAMMPGDDAFAAQAAAAGTALQGALGVSFRMLVSGDLAAEARARPFDALLIADHHAAATQAMAAREAGLQALLALPVLDQDQTTLAALDGAWLASPDPTAMAAFADRYRQVTGAEAGLLVALAADAAMIARRIGRGGRSALLDPAGFAGATGRIRFQTDGGGLRDLAILAAGRDGYAVIGAAASA